MRAGHPAGDLDPAGGHDLAALLRARVRDVEDFPTPGVLFKDITPLLADPAAFAGAVDAVVAHYGRGSLDAVVGIEARGFILAAPVAYHAGAALVPVRKAGKLPGRTLAATYALEYATATVEMHADAFAPGDRVLVVDDVLATGGTIEATVDLVERAGATVSGIAVLIELTAFGGRGRLAGRDVFALLTD